MITHKNKPVLITGCSSGIGLGIALGLAGREYRVFATVRNEQDIDTLKKEGLESLRLDLSSSMSVDRALTDILERTNGELYAVINNGAYGQHGAVEDLSRDVLRAQFETNVFGTHELTSKIIPVFRNQGGGRIIQISSILGLICLPHRGAYNASKYALEALSDTMRLELYHTNIFVSLIEPGPIESRFRANAFKRFQANIDPECSAHRAAYLQLIRRLNSDENVRFTLSPDAVLNKIIHALESPNPRPRYLVTVPAHVLARLKHWLPDRLMDRLIRRFNGT